MIIDHFQKIFVGEDPMYPEFNGNTIFVQITDHRYIFIGDQVCEFTTEDIIQQYYSPLIGSDVPYPYAKSDKNTYLITEHVFLPNISLSNYEDNVDPYRIYYDLPHEEVLLIIKNKKININILAESPY